MRPRTLVIATAIMTAVLVTALAPTVEAAICTSSPPPPPGPVTVDANVCVLGPNCSIVEAYARVDAPGSTTIVYVCYF